MPHFLGIRGSRTVFQNLIVFSSPQFTVTTAMSKSAWLLQWCFAIVCCAWYCLMLLFYFVSTASFFLICAMLYQRKSMRSMSKTILWIQLLFYLSPCATYLSCFTSETNSKVFNSVMTYVPCFSPSLFQEISSLSKKVLTPQSKYSPSQSFLPPLDTQIASGCGSW